MKNALIRMLTISLFLLAGCSDSGQIPEATSSVQTGERGESLEAIAHDAFIYAYPMMEQVKTVNGMFEFMGLGPNKVAMNAKLPWESVGMPIVAPNLTSMTGAFLSISRTVRLLSKFRKLKTDTLCINVSMCLRTTFTTWARAVIVARASVLFFITLLR